MGISLSYGTRTEFGSDAEPREPGSTAACAVGAVDNHSAGNVGYLVDFTIVGASIGRFGDGDGSFLLDPGPQ